MKYGLLMAALVLSMGCSRQSNQTALSSNAFPGPDGGTASAAPAPPPSSSEQPIAIGEASPAPGVSEASPAAGFRSPDHPIAAQPVAMHPAPQYQPAPGPERPSAAPPRNSPALRPSALAGGNSAEQHTIVIPQGTALRVRLAETVDTKYWRAGQRFHAELDAPLTSGDRVIVPRGTVFTGHVTESKPSGRLKGRAYLALTLNSFRVGGKTYLIRTNADGRMSGSHKKRNLAYIGGGSGGGAAIGAIAGGGVGALIGAGAGAAAGTTTAFFTGRKQVTLPVETPLVFTLHSPVRLIG